MNLTKTLSFGKVDYNRSGRKNCLVTVDVELKDGTLSICGNVWNHLKSDTYLGGQCLDDLQKLLPHDKKLARIVAIWDRWHLNHMRAGCQHQREAGWTWQTHPSVHCPMCGYAYGSAWLREELPQSIIDEVTAW